MHERAISLRFYLVTNRMLSVTWEKEITTITYSDQKEVQQRFMQYDDEKSESAWQPCENCWTVKALEDKT